MLIFTANERQVRVLERMKPEVSAMVALAQQQASEPVNIREGITVLVGILTTLGCLLRYSNRRCGTHLCDSYSLLKRWKMAKLRMEAENS